MTQLTDAQLQLKGEDYSRNGGGSGNADGALADILEALKNG